MKIVLTKNNSESYDALLRKESIIIGILTLSNLIVTCISQIIDVENLFPLLIVSLSLTELLFIRKKVFLTLIGRKIYIPIFLVILALQLIVSFMLIKSTGTTQFAKCFICIAIPTLYISSDNFNCTLIRHTMLWVGIMLLPLLIRFMYIEYTVYNSDVQMGLSYAMLPLVMACIWQLFEHDDTRYKVLAGFILIFCVLIISMLMTRGPIFALLIFVVWLYIKYFGSSSRKIAYGLFVVALITAAYYLFIRKILIQTHWYRIIFTVKSNNFMNGRETDISNCFKWRGGFAFLFGSGIGSYLLDYGRLYVHNLFLHVYYEQGILVLVFLIILIKNVLSTIKSSNNIFLILLFCTSIIRLMVSYYYWIDVNFWLLLGLANSRALNKSDQLEC